ncbi:hypothetical protein PENSTE_c002G03182 [Penicillium steckii]|uniref:Uncharacterized protein n=1 Tax=Penicillium steckii TaxID=303698 RepID=A0A1V6TWN3_9EURO|nr:hypothetical protein PENSTE_c002G03182 [Penicillium steckii]
MPCWKWLRRRSPISKWPCPTNSSPTFPAPEAASGCLAVAGRQTLTLPPRTSSSTSPGSPGTSSSERAHDGLQMGPELMESLKRNVASEEGPIEFESRGSDGQRKKPRLNQESRTTTRVEEDGVKGTDESGQNTVLEDSHREVREFPLHVALQGGRDEIVKALLAGGADVEIQDPLGRTAIFYAILGNEEPLRLILSRQANIRHKDYRGLTPLLYAVYQRRDRAVHILLEHGADVTATNNIGDNALRLCVDIPSPKSACQGTTEASLVMMKLLLEYGADLNICSTAFDMTPLLNTAAFSDFVAGAQLLIENGAGIEEVDLMDRTPLLNACNTFKTTDGSMARLLLQRGAEVEHRDHKGRTALALAASRGQDMTVRILLTHGANIEARDLVLRTPLMHAVREGWPSVATVLLENGARVNVMQRAGLTPLAVAIKALRRIIEHSKRHSNQRHVKVIGQLLSYGADANLLSEEARRILNGISQRDGDGWSLSERVVADVIQEAEASARNY